MGEPAAAREVAEYLNVPVFTVLRWYERGFLPGRRVNGSVGFVPSEVDKWLIEQRLGPGEPADDEFARWLLRRRVLHRDAGCFDRYDERSVAWIAAHGAFDG